MRILPALSAAVLLTAVGCQYTRQFHQPAYTWQVEHPALGNAEEVKAVSMYQRDEGEAPDRAVLTDPDGRPGARNFEWRNQTLREVIESTGKQVRARNADADFRLDNARINSRFGPLEEELRYPLIHSIADMHGVIISDDTSWNIHVIDAWGTGELILAPKKK